MTTIQPLSTTTAPPYAAADAWARFIAKTIVMTRHTLWLGAIADDGYGRFHDPGYGDELAGPGQRSGIVRVSRWVWSPWEPCCHRWPSPRFSARPAAASNCRTRPSVRRGLAVLALLALGGVIYTTVLQIQDRREGRLEANRNLHLELMKFGIAHPGFLEIWGPRRDDLWWPARSPTQT